MLVKINKDLYVNTSEISVVLRNKISDKTEIHYSNGVSYTLVEDISPEDVYKAINDSFWGKDK